MKTNSCESCLMPFDRDPGQRESEKYCSLCYANGKLNYEGNDLKVFQKKAFEGMRSRGMNPVTAWFFAQMIRFAPRWRKK